MSLELLGRIQQELSITGSAIYETILALAERANRKVQVLRLHSQASNLLSQIEQGSRRPRTSNCRALCKAPTVQP